MEEGEKKIEKKEDKVRAPSPVSLKKEVKKEKKIRKKVAKKEEKIKKKEVKKEKPQTKVEMTPENLKKLHLTLGIPD